MKVGFLVVIVLLSGCASSEQSEQMQNSNVTVSHDTKKCHQATPDVQKVENKPECDNNSKAKVGPRISIVAVLLQTVISVAIVLAVL